MIQKIHKLLCLVTGPLIIAWLLSGMVMIYSGHPKAHRSARDRLPKTAPLAAEAISLSFQDALEKVELSAPPAEARLNMLAGRPAYFFRSQNAELKVVYADDGSVLNSVTEKLARMSASVYLKKDMTDAIITPLDQPDQWTVGTATRPWHWPLYRIQCQDADGTLVYVSGRSGEVCQVITGSERILTWLGAIPHWLYFTALRKHQELWRQVILWTAGTGTVGVALGLWIGIIRFRWKGYGRNRYLRSSAYVGIKKWHHYLGLIFGLPMFLWIFSGMLSLSPFHWHSETSPSIQEAAVMAGVDQASSQVVLNPADALKACANQGAVRKMDLIRFAGTPYYLCWFSRDCTTLVRADKPAASPVSRLSSKALVKQARGLMPACHLKSQVLLHKYDLYHVDKNKQSVLPVLRIIFDDPDNTRFYINVNDGTIISRYDRTARVNRWLYRFLHCLDIPFLINHHLIREALMLFFLAGGSVLGATGFYSWTR